MDQPGDLLVAAAALEPELTRRERRVTPAQAPSTDRPTPIPSPIGPPPARYGTHDPAVAVTRLIALSSRSISWLVRPATATRSCWRAAADSSVLDRRFDSQDLLDDWLNVWYQDFFGQILKQNAMQHIVELRVHIIQDAAIIDLAWRIPGSPGSPLGGPCGNNDPLGRSPGRSALLHIVAGVAGRSSLAHTAWG